MELFDVSFFQESFPSILERLPITLGVAVGSFAFAIVIGLVVALLKIYKVRILQNLANLYLSFTRGTPLLVQLFIFSYGVPRTIFFLQTNYGLLPDVNWSLINPLIYAFFVYSFNYAAYLAEAIRTSIEAVGVGQFEAAKAAGMNGWQSITRIVLPQALSHAIPNLGNSMVGMVKDTSFLFVVNIVDVMGQARMIGLRTGSFFEVYIAAALVYLVCCFVIERIFDWVEKRSSRHIKRAATIH